MNLSTQKLFAIVSYRNEIIRCIQIKCKERKEKLWNNQKNVKLIWKQNKRMQKEEKGTITKK